MYLFLYRLDNIIRAVLILQEKMSKKVTNEWGPKNINVQIDDDLLAAISNDINIELSVHSVASISYLRELQSVFPNWTIPASAVVIATMQNASMDLVGIGAALENEKDILLERVS